MPSLLLFWLWFLLGTIIFWSVLLTVVRRFEKKVVWPYGELEASPYFGDPTEFGARAIGEAIHQGFTFLGWARDIKGPIYKVSYAMLVSPDRQTLAVVGVGKILQIPLNAIWLHTPASDGRSFCSTSHQSGVQLDISGNWKNQLISTSSFATLLQGHVNWVRGFSISPRLFSPGNECAEYRDVRERHFRSMESAGLVRFDNSTGYCYFTWWGAAKTSIWGYFLGMARKLSNGKFPRTA